jgi:hypothetical protein
MQVANYLGLIRRAEEQLAEAFEKAGRQHALEIDVLQMCKLFASWSKDHAENIQFLIKKYGEKKDDEPHDLFSAVIETRMGALGMLRDLQGLWLMAGEVEMCYIVLLQAAQALRDKELELSCRQFGTFTHRQKSWLLTRIKHAASQTLVVAES